MSLSGSRIGRGRLLVVRAPRGPAPTPARVGLCLRAVLVRIRLFWLDLVALAGASVALAPLLFRRRPLRHRTQVPRPAAQVIALQPRRRAAPP